MLIHVQVDLNEVATTGVDQNSFSQLLDLLDGHAILHGYTGAFIDIIKEKGLDPLLQTRLRFICEKLFRDGRATNSMISEVHCMQSILDPLIVKSSSQSSDETTPARELPELFDMRQELSYPTEAEELPPNQIFRSKGVWKRSYWAPQNHLVIRRGTHRVRVWQALFDPYAHAAAQIPLPISVFDRYALKRDSDNLKGLLFFMEKLGDYTCPDRPLSVTIYSSGNRENVDGHWRRCLEADKDAREQLMSTGQASKLHLKIIACDDRDFKKWGHGRYLRFKSLTWRLDSGVDLFSNELIDKAHRISFSHICEEDLEIEKKLRDRRF